jgi:hypothetical protein
VRSSLDHINRYRLRTGPYASTPADGPYGFFMIPIPGRPMALYCMVSAGGEGSSGEGWEHVSVRTEHATDPKKGRCPTWEEMCIAKNLFWDEEETVMQLHPPKSEWINNHPHVLHLWKPTHCEIPRPPGILVGKRDDREVNAAMEGKT